MARNSLADSFEAKAKELIQQGEMLMDLSGFLRVGEDISRDDREWADSVLQGGDGALESYEEVEYLDDDGENYDQFDEEDAFQADDNMHQGDYGDDDYQDHFSGSNFVASTNHNDNANQNEACSDVEQQEQNVPIKAAIKALPSIPAANAWRMSMIKPSHSLSTFGSSLMVPPTNNARRIVIKPSQFSTIDSSSFQLLASTSRSNLPNISSGIIAAGNKEILPGIVPMKPSHPVSTFVSSVISPFNPLPMVPTFALPLKGQLNISNSGISEAGTNDAPGAPELFDKNMSPGGTSTGKFRRDSVLTHSN